MQFFLYLIPLRLGRTFKEIPIGRFTTLYSALLGSRIVKLSEGFRSLELSNGKENKRFVEHIE